MERLVEASKPDRLFGCGACWPRRLQHCAVLATAGSARTGQFDAVVSGREGGSRNPLMGFSPAIIMLLDGRRMVPTKRTSRYVIQTKYGCFILDGHRHLLAPPSIF
jgi:hypothetical protein